MNELELKLGLPPEALSSLRDALLARGAERIAMKARYFDTPDGRLAEHRIALRLRLEGERWVQTLKAEGDSAVSRLEHEVPLHEREPALLDVHRHDGTAVGARLMQALDGNAAPLDERHGTDVTRLRCELHDNHGGVVEVALDEGRATGGGRSSPIAELEIEHKQGPLAGLFELARAWTLHGGLWLITLPKSARGHRLWREEPVRAAKLREIALDRHADGAALLRGIFHPLLDAVLANAGEVAEGHDDTEIVHQLRVGLRRLRTALRELSGLSPTIEPSWESTLAATFAQLGARRDAEVVSEAVRPLLEAVQAPITAWQPPAEVDVVAAVRDSRFQCTLIEMLAWLHADDGTLSSATGEEARELICHRLSSLHRKVAKAARRFEAMAPDQQHHVRKRLKRLRYLAEMTQSLWSAKAAARYIEQLKPAQDALGHHNDVATAANAFRADAVRDPHAWFAAGFLQAHLAVTARDARRSLRKLRKAEPFWAS